MTQKIETKDKVVGIDVSKAYLDCVVDGLHRRFKNDDSGFRKLVEFAKSQKADLAVVEACHYHKSAHKRLTEAGLPVHVAPPHMVRSFASALGVTAKTDKLDATVIAKYGEVLVDGATPVPSEDQEEFQRLVTARKQVVDDIGRNKNRLDKVPELDSVFEKLFEALEHTKAAIENQIRQVIGRRSCAKFARWMEILQSIPGIGETTAWTLCALLPELGTVNNKQIAALVGLAPMNCDSGEFRGKRKTKGGRSNLRRMLFMSGMVAGNHNPELRRFKQKKEAEGKPTKVIRIAIMRKLVVLANALIRDDRLWSDRTTDGKSASIVVC